MKNQLTNWRTWLRGLIGAFVGASANAITLMLVKPEDFNFAAGWSNLWHFAVVSGVVSAALYLKQHPVPDEEKDAASGGGAGAAMLLFFMVALAGAGLTGGLTGCATLAPAGAYNGDKVLYVADQTDVAAYKVLHAFVTFEYENRAALAAHPEIKAAADDIRTHAPDWFARYDRARELYVKARSPETLAAFNAAVAQLKAGVTKATDFLFSAQTLVSK